MAGRADKRGMTKRRRPGPIARTGRLIRRVFTLGVGAGIGAAAAYLLDPDRGRSRRAQGVDQLQAVARRQRDSVQRQGRYLAGRLQGTGHAARQAVMDDASPPASDKALGERVRSQVLGRQEFAGFVVNLDAHDGVVALRGELPDNGTIRSLCEAVSTVTGVEEVHSFLHLPNTPAPNKAEAIRRAGGETVAPGTR